MEVNADAWCWDSQHKSFDFRGHLEEFFKGAERGRYLPRRHISDINCSCSGNLWLFCRKFYKILQFKFYKLLNLARKLLVSDMPMSKQEHSVGSTSGGRPATTTSRLSHILLIFSSKPPRNPRPSIIMCFKFPILEDKTIFFNYGHIRANIWID